MRRLILCLALATVITPQSAPAQVTVNMSGVTCADYLSMTSDQSRVFSAWMSGWFNQKHGFVWVGLTDFATNVTSVKQWCTGFPRELVMAALDRAKPSIPSATGQVRVDMSLITCKQYLGSNPERQEMIASWMSGYFRGSRNQPIFDFQRFANNKRAVGNYCKKRGGETLMSAIQRSAK